MKKKKKNEEFLKLQEIFSLEENSGMTVPVNPSQPSTEPQDMQNLSLDMKVDSYFMKYEKESLPTSNDYSVDGSLMESLKIIFEAEGDEDPLGGGAGDFGGEDETQGAPAQPQAPQVPNPRFNATNFAQSIARLIMNFEGLVDPKTVVLNRAKAFVTKNYDAGVAEQMMEILKSQFGLEPSPLSSTSEIQAPIAAGAWTGVGGGGG